MLGAQNPIMGVVFDLDGTLIDSAPDLLASANYLLGQRGRREITLAELHHMVGDGARKLVERAFAATGGPCGESLDDLYAQYLDHYEGNGVRLTTAYPGAAQTLARLTDAGYVLGLCTNKPQRPTEIVLRDMGLDQYFSAIVGGDAVVGPDGEVWRKPDARHLNHTLKLMGVASKNALMIGDSAADVDVAKNAGVPVIAVSFGYTKIPVDQLGADRVIDKLDELPKILSTLAATVA